MTTRPTSRLIMPEQAPATPGVRERRVIDRATGEIRFVKTQNVEPMFDAIRAAKELPKNPTMRYIGSIPILLAQQWARECKFAIGTKGWREYAHKKLRDGDYAKLRGE